MGRGRKSSSVFLRRINFFLNQGTIHLCSQTIKFTDGAFGVFCWFFFFHNKGKDVNVSLLGNTRKFQQGYIMEHCFLASVVQQRRKCSVLFYKEHSSIYFFY